MRVATALSESGRDGKTGVAASTEVGVAVVVEVGIAAIIVSVRMCDDRPAVTLFAPDEPPAPARSHGLGGLAADILSALAVRPSPLPFPHAALLGALGDSIRWVKWLGDIRSEDGVR